VPVVLLFNLVVVLVAATGLLALPCVILATPYRCLGGWRGHGRASVSVVPQGVETGDELGHLLSSIYPTLE
jgi:hypothetical protein